MEIPTPSVRADDSLSLQKHYKLQTVHLEAIQFLSSVAFSSFTAEPSDPPTLDSVLCLWNQNGVVLQQAIHHHAQRLVYIRREAAMSIVQCQGTDC